MARKKKDSGVLWHFVESFEGDKVVWMIVLMLIMFSILAISSSTPLLALETGSSRPAIIREQLLIAVLGTLLIVGIYNIRRIKLLRTVSQLGFLISFGLLAILVFRINLGGIKALKVNEAWRAISIFGKFTLHVSEVVKVCMVMYLAWAVDTYKKDGFVLANRLAGTKHFAFMGKDFSKKVLYIYGPILAVTVMLLDGSNSSALFIGGIMGLTILIGGIRIRELIPVALVLVLLLGIATTVSVTSEGKYFGRINTAYQRLQRFSEKPEEQLLAQKRGTAAFQEVLDKVRQPISAKVAVSEGGFFGKGPGGSTQRYIVPVMFGDYMYSFIIEEYGLLGGIIVLILYCSLLARGSLIARNCESLFAKTAIAGLVILISGQAMMHMLVNVDLVPMTGQTLPMISHGNSSFLAFSVAFGIILAISRMARKKIEKVTDQARPISEVPEDDLKARLDELDDLDIY